jgi:hypothetical protein
MKENLLMTNNGNGDHVQPDVDPVPTIPHTAQQHDEPIMQTNLIDEAQDDAVELEDNKKWDDEEDEDVIYLLFSIFSVKEFSFFWAFGNENLLSQISSNLFN